MHAPNQPSEAPDITQRKMASIAELSNLSVPIDHAQDAQIAPTQGDPSVESNRPVSNPIGPPYPLPSLPTRIDTRGSDVNSPWSTHSSPRKRHNVDWYTDESRALHSRTAMDGPLSRFEGREGFNLPRLYDGPSLPLPLTVRESASPQSVHSTASTSQPLKLRRILPNTVPAQHQVPNVGSSRPPATVNAETHAMAGPYAAPLSASSPLMAPPVQMPDARQYQIVIRQHPVRARMCGFGNKDRRSMDPPPVIECICTNSENPNDTTRKKPLKNPYLTIHASLLSQDGKTEYSLLLKEGRKADRAVPSPSPPARSTPHNESIEQHQPFTRALAGSVIAKPELLLDDNGIEGLFAIFSELNVRTEGYYRLKFSLYSLEGLDLSPAGAGSRVPCLGEAISNEFRSWQAKEFPGMGPSTELSKALSHQGRKVIVRSSTRVPKNKGGAASRMSKEAEASKSSDARPSKDCQQGKRGRKQSPGQQGHSPSVSASSLGTSPQTPQEPWHDEAYERNYHRMAQDSFEAASRDALSGSRNRTHMDVPEAGAELSPDAQHNAMLERMKQSITQERSERGHDQPGSRSKRGKRGPKK